MKGSTQQLTERYCELYDKTWRFRTAEENREVGAILMELWRRAKNKKGGKPNGYLPQ